MNPIHITPRIMSLAFWKSLERMGPAPMKEILSCEKNRAFATYDTGTISPGDAETLWRLGKCFRPKVVAEIGTFIGTSATALYLGSGATVYTCDKSNDCFEAEWAKTHPFKTSTEMLSDIKEKVDLFFIDGKLNPEDVGLIDELRTDDTVFVFDDYEGVEKGVQNVAMLSAILKKMLFIQPIADGLAVSISQHMMTIKVQ